MSIQLNAPVLRNSQAHPSNNGAEQSHASPIGLAGNASSLRSQVNAGASSSSLCGCFESLINWIKGLLFNLLPARASQAPAQPPAAAIESPPATVPRTDPETLLNKADEFLDLQFNTPGLSYPLKAICFLKYNGRLIASPDRQVNAALDLDRFKTSVKQDFALRTMQMLLPFSFVGTTEVARVVEETVQLEVETCFFSDVGTDPENPMYDIAHVSNHRDLTTGQERNNIERLSGRDRYQTAGFFLGTLNAISPATARGVLQSLLGITAET